MTDDAVQVRHDIQQVLIDYTRAVDTADWDRLDRVFTPDATIDYTGSGGIAGDFATVKAWLAEVLVIFPNRLHLLGQIDIVPDGETEADVHAYFHNPMVLAETGAVWEYGGLYHHRMVRTPDGWRSARLHEEIVWRRT